MACSVRHTHAAPLAAAITLSFPPRSLLSINALITCRGIGTGPAEGAARIGIPLQSHNSSSYHRVVKKLRLRRNAPSYITNSIIAVDIHVLGRCSLCTGKPSASGSHGRRLLP